MQSHSCAQATPWLPSLHGDGNTCLEHPQTPVLGCCGAPGQTLCGDLPRGCPLAGSHREPAEPGGPVLCREEMPVGRGMAQPHSVYHRRLLSSCPRLIFLLAPGDRHAFPCKVENKTAASSLDGASGATRARPHVLQQHGPTHRYCPRVVTVVAAVTPCRRDLHRHAPTTTARAHLHRGSGDGAGVGPPEGGRAALRQIKVCS